MARKRPLCFSLTEPQRLLLEDIARRDAVSLSQALRSLVQKELLRTARVADRDRERREAAQPVPDLAAAAG